MKKKDENLVSLDQFLDEEIGEKGSKKRNTPAVGFEPTT